VFFSLFFTGVRVGVQAGGRAIKQTGAHTRVRVCMHVYAYVREYAGLGLGIKIQLTIVA
jgi:hypothetical protein